MTRNDPLNRGTLFSLQERMRARISSMVSQEPQRIAQAEFVRPYVATGREAAEVEVHRDPVSLTSGCFIF